MDELRTVFPKFDLGRIRNGHFFSGVSRKVYATIDRDGEQSSRAIPYVRPETSLPPNCNDPDKAVNVMNENRAREILGEAINADNSIGPSYGHFMEWAPDYEVVILDDGFTVDELEALAWWMRNFTAKKS